MWQHFLTKLVLKPSGPGALSEGSILTTWSISSSVKGRSRRARSADLCNKFSKSRPILAYPEIPNLSLYAFQSKVALPE